MHKYSNSTVISYLPSVTSHQTVAV